MVISLLIAFGESSIFSVAVTNIGFSLPNKPTEQTKLVQIPDNIGGISTFYSNPSSSSSSFYQVSSGGVYMLDMQRRKLSQGDQQACSTSEGGGKSD